MTLLQELMHDLEYLQAKIDYAIKEHPDYTEYLVDAKERLEEADSILYGIDGLEVIMLENSNIDMKGLSYDESHIQSIYSNQLCITIKPFAYNNEDLKTFELGDNNSDVIQNHKLKFLKEVDLAIKEYFMYKYNCDVDELLRISKNVNNFKINERFHKVSTPLQDYYCDGEYCYLTTVQSCAGDLLVKHWLEANCD